MNLKKSLKKNKKSIFSAVLATLLAFSFNYSPISLISSWIKKTSAYKSSNTQTYYGNSTTENETKISAGKYPSELSEFFKESSNNFNIATYYNKRYIEKYAEHVHEYLASIETKFSDVEYGKTYLDFLDFKNYDSLYDYYKTETTYIDSAFGCKDFYAFAEYFVSHETTWKIASDNQGKVPVLFSQEPTRSHFYCALANFILNETNSVKPAPDGNIDGVPSDAKPEEFYEYSISYGRVKKAIDDHIVETVAIYSYDGATQNNNMAGILVNGSPVSQEFYYGSTYVSPNLPDNYTYEIKEIEDDSTHTTYYKTKIYCFGYRDAAHFIETAPATAVSQYEALSDVAKESFVFEPNMSTLENNLMKYKQITPQDPEGGYLSTDQATYYKYDENSKPFEMLDSKNYQLYILDNDVTANEQATYDSLYFKVITSEDLADDDDFAEANNLPAGFFHKLPYNSQGFTDQYYKIVSTYSDAKFTKFCELFGGKLYLKASNKNKTNMVYIDSSENGGIDAALFKAKEPTYDYVIVDIDLNDPNVDSSAFKKVTVSDNRYYRKKSGTSNEYYVLYFQKEKVYFEELDTSDSTYEKDNLMNYVYETSKVPNISYEQTIVPSVAYKIDGPSRKIYALAESISASISLPDGKLYAPVVQESIDSARNFYVEVPEKVYASIYGNNERTHKLYYMHESESVNQIYVVDDSEKALENEVYKNLYYKVITTKTYNESSEDYVLLTATDKNYNKNFKLYYKYEASDAEKTYVQNDMKGDVALFYIDKDVNEKERASYLLNSITPITEDEFNAEKDFFVQVGKEDKYYSTQYPKLYYKYQAKEGVEKKVVYLNTTDKSDTYPTINSSAEGFVATDYKLVEPFNKDGSVNEDYVPGMDLYYKKIRNEAMKKVPQKSYFYYTSSSAVKLTANSFYALSFYVNTTGTYDGTNGIQASLYLTDSNNALDEIKFEHITTDGKWVKYVALIATDAITASSVKLTMYLGDKNSIAGNVSLADDVKVTGSVLFDDIKITKINETDFTKKAIDNEKIKATEEHKNDDGELKNTVSVILANDELDYNVYDYRTRSTINTTVGSWDQMFNFDNSSLMNAINNIPAVNENTDANTPFGASDLWNYYISRDVTGPGYEFELKQYQNAYIAGNLSASVVKETTIDKTSWKEKDEDEDEDKKESESSKEEDKKDEDDNGPATITDTFNDDNSVLKLQNKNTTLNLGLISNGFEIKQFEYYKITVWVYSPEENAKATLAVNSIIKTAATPDLGSLNTVKATVDANFEKYSTTPNSEYGWLPISFYIEGNTLHNQICNLVLTASGNSVVYFDNISIQNVSSSAYDTASSDSDKTTYCLSLVPSKTLVTNGVTNGYFNTITLKEDFINPDPTTPKAPKSWTVNSSNSSPVIAGVVPTSSTYTSLPNNFYQEYNGTRIPYSAGFDSSNSYSNLYGIYAPTTREASFENGETNVKTLNTHKIYSSSISLSTSKIYEISFDFYKGTEFSGDLVANLYYGSVDSAKIISTIRINKEDIELMTNYSWSTYKFYIETSLSSASVYLEIGVEKATGTSFFKDVYCIESSKSLSEIRDDLITVEDNSSTSDENLYNKVSLKNVRFLNFNESISSIHGIELNENSNLYEVKEYKNDFSNTTSYTIGQTGVANASFYENTGVTKTYSVTIDKTTYYIRSFEDETTHEVSYKLFLYNDCTEDCLDEHEVTEIGGKPVKVESFKRVVVGENASTTDYESVETKKNNYAYSFNNDYVVGDTFISADELKNAQSENVLIIANNYGTDYTSLTPVYTKSLKTSGFYLMKIYVKTSDFETPEFGLNINIKSISNAWFNINTTESENKDEFGFVCYKVLIKTNTSSISNLGVTFSLGSEKNTGKGYAIISGVTLESFADEAAFDHYESTIEEDDTTTKKYFGTSSSDSKEEDSSEEESSVTWATFFYIFSSLLLVITIVIALVAVILKKHPIKVSKKVQNDHERDLDVFETTHVSETPKSRKQKKAKEEPEETPDNGNDGIV